MPRRKAKTKRKTRAVRPARSARPARRRAGTRDERAARPTPDPAPPAAGEPAGRPEIPLRWLELFKLLPGGYCPIRTASPGDWFDVPAADHAVGFFPACLKHVKGVLAGQPYELAPWEQAIVGCLYGWRQADGKRRYRQAFIYVPKKNDKTTLASGLVLYALTQGGPGREPERAAEIYSVAASRDQAAIVFQTVCGMVKQNRELPSFARLRLYGDAGGSQQRSITYARYHSVYRPLAADADTADGANVSMAIVDELHRHKSGELLDIMIRGTAARAEPLIVIITTADYDREDSPCNEKYEEACLVRDNGGHPDRPGWNPSFLPVIYEASLKDDWTDPAVWAKANPNLGRSKPVAYMREACEVAKHNPVAKSRFLRLDLNIRVQDSEGLIDLQAWDLCPAGAVADEQVQGRDCFGGMDLGRRDDLAALCLCWPPAENELDTQPWYFRWWLWCPSEVVTRREFENIPYRRWVESGLVTATPGNDVDFAFIRQTILELDKRYGIVSIGYDPWNATQMGQELLNLHGIEMVAMRQGGATLAEPTSRFCGLVRSLRCWHGGNPAMRWQASNAMDRKDENGNALPSKKRSRDKIDGIVAAIMAVGRALQPRPKKSIYRKRGIQYL